MLKTLIKMQLSALAAQTVMKTRKGKSTNKASAGKIILFSILMLYCFGFFAFTFGQLFYSLCLGTAGTEFEWVMVSMASFMTILLCFVGTVFMTQSLIFNSKDNDLLLSMPIPPRVILLSRIVTLALMNRFFALLVFLPAEIAWIAVKGFDLSAILIICLFLLLPLAAMALTLIIGWIIALISSRMKNKNLITMILSVGAMALYFVLCFNLGDVIVSVQENPSVITSLFTDYLGFFIIIGKAATAPDFLSAAITLAVCIIPFALVCMLLSRSFMKIVTDKKSAKKAVYRKKEMKTSSAFAALYKKETGRFFASATYFMNCFMGCIFMLLLTVAAIFNAGSINTFISEISSELLFLPVPSLICFGLIAVITLISAFNIPTAVTISLEAKSMWILKSIPVRTKDILLAKLWSATVMTAIPNLVFAAVSIFLFRLDLLYAIPVIISAFAMPFLSAGAGIIINMLMPRFDWVNETVCVKQSGSTIISMLAMLFAAMIIVGLGGLILFTVSAVGGICFTLGIIIVLSAAAYIIVGHCFEKRFTELG